MDAFAIARLVIGAAFLAVAGASDVRTRRVRDPLWVALGSIGLLILLLQLLSIVTLLNSYLYVASGAILFYAVFYGKPVIDEEGVHARPARILVLATAAVAYVAALWAPLPSLDLGVLNLPGTDPLLEIVSLPILILLYQAFYQLGLIRGGADAKGLIALALLVPVYPNLSPFPLIQSSPLVSAAMQVVFPFSLVVFVDAAILILVVPLAYLSVNMARREFEWPVGFLGTKVPIDSVPRHTWVMERIGAHGERYAVLFPSRKSDDTEEIEKLRAAGATRIWVEPKIPFILLLFFGYILAFVVGNVILGALTALLPPA